MNMIEIDRVQKRFGDHQVLKGISLNVQKGQTCVIIGRSGAGKSVLLKSIAGLIHPDSGTINVFGQEIAHLDEEGLAQVRQRIGYVFQNAALYDSMTVHDNLAFHLTRHRKISAAETETTIREKLEFVGLAEAIHKYPSELSGGMKKRVGLARSLVLSPEIMLYDEPTTGLDPITASEIDELILHLQDSFEVTAISITHSLESALRTGDRIAVFHDGRVIEFKNSEEFLNSSHQFVQEYLSKTSLTLPIKVAK